MHNVITSSKIAKIFDDEVGALHPSFSPSAVMSDSPPPDVQEKRSFACFPTLHTERIVFDVSNLPIGDLEGRFKQDTSETSKSAANSPSDKKEG